MEHYYTPRDSANLFVQTRELCKKHGFSSRGKSFFRVIGDGILQVLKYKSEARRPADVIDVGLFSLYGELKKEWVTSTGSIPRYELFRVFVDVPMTFQSALTSHIDIKKQYSILENQGFAWLDSIVTQQQLVEAICQLDMTYSGHIRWNDMEKFAPFLASGQYENAQRVIQSIINQHNVAIENNRSYFSPEDYRELVQHHEKENEALIFKLNLAREDNLDLIRDYLTTNFVANKKLTEFCFKKKN